MASIARLGMNPGERLMKMHLCRPPQEMKFSRVEGLRRSAPPILPKEPAPGKPRRRKELTQVPAREAGVKQKYSNLPAR
jgi:hypothetical protein